MASGIRCSSPTTLTLIRHGQSQGNVDRCFGGHSETPLTPLGLQQAQDTATYLASETDQAPITHIIASDLPRTIQTAQPIAEALGLPLLTHPGLRERSVGELDGQPFHVAKVERPELWKHLLSHDPHWTPPGGESVHEGYLRISACLADLVQSHEGGHLVLVTHAIIMHLGINVLLDLDSDAAMSRYFAVSNASRSVFVLGPSRTQVSAINQVGHLQTGT